MFLALLALTAEERAHISIGGVSSTIPTGYRHSIQTAALYRLMVRLYINGKVMHEW